MIPQTVSDHYRQQQRRALVTIAAARAEWARMGNDFDSSWAFVGPRLSLLVGAAQRGAAEDGAAYVTAALAEQNLDQASLASPDPAGFVGAWPLGDGGVGQLTDLLYGAVVQARTVTASNAAERLAAGQRWLDGTVATQIADASRQAAGTAIALTPKTGWTRMVNPPCCQRCAVLAGKFFRWNDGFSRHPRCDCRHVPTSQAGAHLAGIVIGPDEVKDLTVAQRQAIADGADFNRVVNPKQRRSGMSTTATGGPAVRRRKTRRDTPEAIYAKTRSREEAARLLASNGYTAGRTARLAA